MNYTKIIILLILLFCIYQMFIKPAKEGFVIAPQPKSYCPPPTIRDGQTDKCYTDYNKQSSCAPGDKQLVGGRKCRKYSPIQCPPNNNEVEGNKCCYNGLKLKDSPTGGKTCAP